MTIDHSPRSVDLTDVPDAVADAIIALVDHAGPGSLPGSTRERLGDLIQAAEQVKAFADACALDATVALVDGVAAQHGVPRDDPRYATKVAIHRKQGCRAVAHEVQLLTGSTLTAARDRVRFATAMPDRVAVAREALREGRCTWERARIAYAETAHLDPVLAGEVIGRVLAPPTRTTGPDGRAAGIPLSHSGFRARLRRQLALIDSESAERDRRHAAAVERRDACSFAGADGTASFQLTGDATKVFTAQQRIADLAKAARAAGDPRTLAQLRADIAADLLIRGTVPGDELLGHAPAGRLHVIVNLATLLPADALTAAFGGHAAAHGVGEVPGLGFLTADQVREVAIRAGSIWTRVVTDPVTGVVIDAANTYRVPRQMDRLVRARDHTCRAPGDCGVTATESDLDHDTEYVSGSIDPGRGATHPANLHALHRGHHNAKTGRFWHSQQHPDAGITWQTLTRRLRTIAYDHNRPDDHAPPTVSRVEQQVGIRLALVREHDVIPNAFTDLDDLRLLDDCPHAIPRHGAEVRHVDNGPTVELPDPPAAPPPF